MGLKLQHGPRPMITRDTAFISGRTLLSAPAGSYARMLNPFGASPGTRNAVTLVTLDLASSLFVQLNGFRHLFASNGFIA
uniref:Uncharacterized protein n=1 Tax=Knipowitschia caucasica TaxID=637954 RepID=A0AAV2K445_KNICA